MTRLSMLRIAGTTALLLAGSATFAATTFVGSDDGAPPTGPFPSSTAAQTAFLAAASAFGTVLTNGFETTAVAYAPVTAITGATITTASPDFGTSLSGVTNGTYGGVYGFNTTSGGANWYGFPNTAPATAVFNFVQTTNSFGFFFTGVQTNFTTAITLTQLDGSALVFNLPINTNGGANYFGVVDSTGFTSVSLTLNSGGDAWGIDDVSFNTAVPEAGTWAMLIAGFGLVGAAARRRRALPTA